MHLAATHLKLYFYTIYIRPHELGAREDLIVILRDIPHTSRRNTKDLRHVVAYENYQQIKMIGSV